MHRLVLIKSTVICFIQNVLAHLIYLILFLFFFFFLMFKMLEHFLKRECGFVTTSTPQGLA